VSSDQPTAPKARSLRRALLLASLLIFLDAFYVNSGAIALLVGLWVLVIGLPRTFLAKKFVAVRRQRLRDIAIYIAAVILVFVFNAANNNIAKRRADVLVSAVKAFHTKNQRYPQSLEELVPDYVERIPLAKYTLGLNHFFYRPYSPHPVLFYVESPPFGRPTYSFARDEWTYLD
jgi:hypothetical protein